MRSRLAPSPTGALHLGNARTFLLNWLHVRSAGGTLAMRIEDLDGPRVKRGAAEEALEDLRWLGLDWDGEPLLQSTRAGAHAEALDRLRAAGLVYPCVCTRREIEGAQSAPHEGEAGPPYPGTCRGRFASAEEARAATGREPAWRFREGDFVVAKKTGEAAYMLAVVVDDAFQGVDLVIRGDDLLPATPPQVLLHGALGLPVPRYVHLPLVRGPDGRRLAKRHGDSRIARYREAGVPAERVLGLLAAWSGMGERKQVTAQELLAGFDLARVPRESPVLGPGEERRLLGG